MRSTTGFKLHFWKGKEGVTLELWKGWARLPDYTSAWAAYRTTRTGKEPQPVTLTLTATDEQKYERTFVGRDPAHLFSGQIPVDLRHENGLLVVSCGDIRLLTVPCPDPDEVYFEGKSVVIHRMGPVPAIPLQPLPAPPPTVFETDKPAELTWLGAEASLRRREDGSVELTVEKSPKRTWIATRLPVQGICETIVQLEDVTSNTAVYLGDEQGNAIIGVHLMRDETSGRIMLYEAERVYASASIKFDHGRWPAAFVGGKVWLRLLLTGGQLKCWASTDGVHWGRAYEPVLEHPAQSYATLILACQGEQPRGSLRCAPAVGARVSHAQQPGSHGVGASGAAASRSAHDAGRLARGDPGQEAGKRRSSGLDTCLCRARLSGGVGLALTISLLDHLLEFGLGQAIPWEEKLRLVDEVMTVLPKCDPANAERFMHSYERLGRQERRDGELFAYSRVRQSIFQSPIWTTRPFAALPRSLATAELLELIQAGRWKEVETLGRASRVLCRAPSIFDFGNRNQALAWRDGRPASLCRRPAGNCR